MTQERTWKIQELTTEGWTSIDPVESDCQNIGQLETSGDRAMQLISVSAAARHLGYKSRSQAAAQADE